jgi:hypothetical protein
VATGTVAFTDTLARTLTYSTGGFSTGGGAVSVNSATGAFTYTPTRNQRLTSAGNTDTFTITASNGVNTATKTVTVSVKGIDTLNANEELTRGQSLTSANGIYTLTLGNDGYARVQENGAAGRGTLMTWGDGQVTRTPMQDDGNWVLYRANGTAWGASGPQGVGNRIVMQDDGNLVVYRTNGSAAWASNTSMRAPVAGTPTVGTPGAGTGAVTGSALFTEPLGLGLAYSTGGSSTGGGTVSVDAATGAFTYTPTADQRRTATSSTTDTFTIIAKAGNSFDFVPVQWSSAV